jgi:dihydropteroate synthase
MGEAASITRPVWRCGRFDLALDRPVVMGVLNVTPDSFSDGDKYSDPLSALARGGRIAMDGAAVIDVGGESTRPGSDPVPVAEEIARVRPVVTALARDLPMPISVDTRNAACAAACLEAGASIINDVGGFRDPEMLAVAAASTAGCVIMHMQGEPKVMQRRPHYRDVVAEVAEFLCAQAEALEAEGIAPERIVIDPGIGFGKTAEHNLTLLHGISELSQLGYPLLIGASRKSVIGAVLDEPDALNRLEGSLAVAAWAATHGAAIVRAHDVPETVKVLRTIDAIARGAL